MIIQVFRKILGILTREHYFWKFCEYQKKIIKILKILWSDFTTPLGKLFEKFSER